MPTRPPNVDPRYALAWVGVYFCRVVLIVNGIIYASGGVAYVDSTYQAIAVYGNASQHIFPNLVPSSETISSQIRMAA